MTIPTAAELPAIHAKILRNRVRHRRFWFWVWSLSVFAYLAIGFCYGCDVTNRRMPPGSDDLNRGFCVLLTTVAWPVVVCIDAVAMLGKVTRITPADE
jgi:hypothetical protein